MLKIEVDKVWVESVKGQPIKEYLYEKLKLSRECEEVIRVQGEFERDISNYFIRGKWALCFMIKLLEHIMDDARYHAPSVYTGETNAPKRLCQLTQGGTMIMLAPRIVPSKNLEYFLQDNITYA